MEKKKRKTSPITRKQAMTYMCWRCMGEFADGQVDCEDTTCPLYYYMPYGDRATANLEFMKYNPHRKGEILLKKAKK